jgi:hypothetical protein
MWIEVMSINVLGWLWQSICCLGEIFVTIINLGSIYIYGVHVFTQVTLLIFIVLDIDPVSQNNRLNFMIVMK